MNTTTCPLLKPYIGHIISETQNTLTRTFDEAFNVHVPDSTRKKKKIKHETQIKVSFDAY